MSKPNLLTSWHLIDEGDAKNLIRATGGQSGVFKLPVSNLPLNLQKIPGINLYYASGYKEPQDIPPNLSLHGEMAIVRIEGEISKHYVFVYAKSDDGTWRFAGPFKDFPLHHTASASPIQVEDLFGRHPFASRNETD